MQVRILKPTKSSMQSGHVRETWTMEFVLSKDANNIDPIMGWTNSKDMMNEVNLEFNTLEEAVKFATSNNYEYSIIKPNAPAFIKKKYLG